MAVNPTKQPNGSEQARHVTIPPHSVVYATRSRCQLTQSFPKRIGAPSIRWMPPPNDADYSIRWRNIKRFFTVTVPTEQPPRLR
jgi:hypothetical protein